MMYYPVSDAQIRINDDGTLELSGKLLLDRLDGFLEAHGVSPDDLKDVRRYLWFFRTNPAVYVKGNASLVNDEVTVDIQALRIGRLTIPADLITDNEERTRDLVERQPEMVPGFSITSLTFEDGQVKFDGTLPAIVSVSTR